MSSCNFVQNFDSGYIASNRDDAIDKKTNPLDPNDLVLDDQAAAFVVAAGKNMDQNQPVVDGNGYKKHPEMHIVAEKNLDLAAN